MSSRRIVSFVGVLLLMAMPSADAYPRPARVEMVTVAIGGEPNSYSHEPRLSDDGRFVAFQSDSSNLVPDDTNGQGDVFVRDLLAGVTTRMSTAADGGQADFNSSAPWISRDGRYVAFSSRATNLVPGDVNGTWDIFVKDRVSGEIRLVSIADDGTQGNGISASPNLDGMAAGLVAFESDATNLVPGDTNGLRDVFVRDLTRGTTTRVSVRADGSELSGVSTWITVSADGRTAAFSSAATDVTPGDTNNRGDSYVKDLVTGTIRRVTVSSHGTESNQGGGTPYLSADGRIVAFSSAASNLVPADTNAGANQFGFADVFVHDLQTGITERVSVSTSGGEGNGVSAISGMSADGRYLAFQSSSTNLVSGDTNNAPDLFLHDRLTGTTERVSLRADGTQASGGLFGGSRATVNADGSVVAFAADHPNIVPGDTGLGFDSDIFVRHRGPALGIAEARAVPDEGGAAIDGAATFSGAIVAAASDARTDGSEALGAELTSATVVHRPEQEDLLVRIAVTKLPGVQGPNVPPTQPGTVFPGTAGAPALVHGLRFTAGGVAHEVRIMRAGATAAPPGSPLFALYRCESVCLEIARLAGGYGTTADEVRASVPLSALGMAAGGQLRDVRAVAGLGEAVAGVVHLLDEVTLPDVTIATPRVELGVASPETPGAEVVFDRQASLTAGRFSGTVPTGDAPHALWARACLGALCQASVVG